MAKWTGLLRQLLSQEEPSSSSRPGKETAGDKAGGLVTEQEGLEYLNKVREKLHQLVEDYSKGWLNQAQFEELYAHYQRERDAVARLITMSPASDAWRMAVTEGQSIVIRRRLAARVLGYAVYVNETEKPLRLYGEFNSLQEKWVKPLLSKIHREVTDSFVTVTFETGSEDAAYLCAVLGQYTTLLVLFTKAPARVQTQQLEDLHHHFEQANERFLARARYDNLVFPYAAAFE